MVILKTKPLIIFLLLVVLALVAACAPPPTPYQPLLEDFGYEETRLQENIYRVSFKANRYTRETKVIDFMYRRSAELTKSSGYSHFTIQQDYGKTQSSGASRTRVSIGMGFFSGARNSAWGAGVGGPVYPSDSGGRIQYHLGIFIIKMLSSAEAKEVKDALEVNFLLESLEKKSAQSLPAES